MNLKRVGVTCVATAVLGRVVVINARRACHQRTALVLRTSFLPAVLARASEAG